MAIDTIRLRVLHTKCMSVCEIAEKLGTTPTVVEAELAKLGLRPHDTSRFTAEPNEIIAEYNAKKTEMRRTRTWQNIPKNRKKKLYSSFHRA